MLHIHLRLCFGNSSSKLNEVNSGPILLGYINIDAIQFEIRDMFLLKKAVYLEFFGELD